MMMPMHTLRALLSPSPSLPHFLISLGPRRQCIVRALFGALTSDVASFIIISPVGLFPFSALICAFDRPVPRRRQTDSHSCSLALILSAPPPLESVQLCASCVCVLSTEQAAAIITLNQQGTTNTRFAISKSERGRLMSLLDRVVWKGHDASLLPCFQLSDSKQLKEEYTASSPSSSSPRRRRSCLLSLSNFTISVIDEFVGCLHFLYTVACLFSFLFLLVSRRSAFSLCNSLNSHCVRACTDWSNWNDCGEELVYNCVCRRTGVLSTTAQLPTLP